MRKYEMTITGWLVGNIWMPNAECYKPFKHSIDGQDSRWSEKGTLRDHVLAATRDGDFQSCKIAEGILEVSMFVGRNGKRITRWFPLDMFPSIADCVKTDWDGPGAEYWED